LGNSPVRSSTGQIGDHLLVAIDDEFPDYVSAVGEVICPGCGELTRARDRLFLVGLGPGTASLPASAEFDAERVGGTTGKYGATVDETGSESQFVAERLERASVIWIRSANSHTGPRQMTAASEAGQMSAPDYALSIPKIPLALQGASTDATKWFATDSPVEREGSEPSVPGVRDRAFRDCPFGMSCAAARPGAHRGAGAPPAGQTRGGGGDLRSIGIARQGKYVAEYRLDYDTSFLWWKGTIDGHEIENFDVIVDNDEGLKVERTAALSPIAGSRAVPKSDVSDAQGRLAA